MKSLLQAFEMIVESLFGMRLASAFVTDFQIEFVEFISFFQLFAELFCCLCMLMFKSVATSQLKKSNQMQANIDQFSASHNPDEPYQSWQFVCPG